MALTAAAAAHPIGFTNRLTFQWWNDQNIKHVQLANHLWGNEEVTRLIGGPFNQEQINVQNRRDDYVEATMEPLPPTQRCHNRFGDTR